MDFYLKYIRPWLHIGALIAIGVMMVSQPDLFDSVKAEGRKAFIKLVFNYIWGKRVGIILLSVGGFLIYRFFRKSN